MAITATQLEDGTLRFSGRAYSSTDAKNKALADNGCVVHNYGIVLALKPDAMQTQALNQQIGNARFIRNRYLSDRIQYYEETKKTPTVSDYKKDYLPKLKNEKETEFLKLSDKFALEAALEHVDAAYKRFFDKQAKFPKYASKHKPSGNQYTTKSTNNNIAVVLKDGVPCVKLPKVEHIPFVLPKGRSVDSIVPKGTYILSCSVKKDTLGFTASLQLETVVEKPEFSSVVRICTIMAIDVGLKDFATIGTTEKVEKVKNPRWIKLHAKRLRRFQKSLAKKKYDKKTHTGSKNYEKAKRLVAKEQRKCANQRKDFQHKLSRRIADTCEVFVCESLNIKGMVKNHRLAREISSVGWGSFLTKVKYKMEFMGKYFLKVDEWYPSSQLCSKCGFQNKEVKDLSVRKWKCPKCGAIHDRDANAARNLINEGVRMLGDTGVTVLA